jgi:hypothetical protein
MPSFVIVLVLLSLAAEAQVSSEYAPLRGLTTVQLRVDVSGEALDRCGAGAFYAYAAVSKRMAAVGLKISVEPRDATDGALVWMAVVLEGGLGPDDPCSCRIALTVSRKVLLLTPEQLVSAIVWRTYWDSVGPIEGFGQRVSDAVDGAAEHFVLKWKHDNGRKPVDPAHSDPKG